VRELRRNWLELPFATRCEAGGQPDPDSIEIVGLRFDDSASQIAVRGTAYFDEVSRGGCADTLIREEQSLALALFIDKESARAYLTDAG
jgi:hypothetical protein